VLLLYAQPADFPKQNILVSPNRTDFNLSQFETTVGLSPPIGGNTFLVGDSSSGPSLLTQSATTCTTAMPSAPSTSGVITFTSLAPTLHAISEFNLGFVLIVCGLIFYSLEVY